MSKTLAQVFAEEQDPCDMGALLREAVEAHCRASGASQADVARSAGLTPGNLSRALQDPNARPSTVRAVCRALGLHVELKEGTGKMNNQITLDILANRAVFVFVAGDDSPLTIRREGSIHENTGVVQVQWVCNEEDEEREEGSGTETWRGPVTEWQAALRRALGLTPT